MGFCQKCQSKFNGRMRTWYHSERCQDCNILLNQQESNLKLT